MRIERLRTKHGVEIEWVPFPLHPDTPGGGRSLEELFADRGYDLVEMQAQMRRRMAAEGLPYGDRTMTYNSRLAQELASWAGGQPASRAIHDALFRAYFADARNIGDPAVLVDVARSVGLPAEAAREVIERRSQRAAVDAAWDRSRRSGITGVPTFVAGHRAVVGAQPYEVLEDLVRLARG